MSLRAPIVSCMPEETARVARAAFPKGHPYLRMRDALGPIYITPEVAALFPKVGQPAAAPAQLALVLMMQFAAGRSDRQAAAAVRSRLDWKYALALDLTDPGFDASVLSEFRSRLIAGKAEALLFETMLTLFCDQGLLKAGGRQRTDATHVLAAIPVLTRLECIGETLRHALNTLAVVAPAWVLDWVPAPWCDRYGRRFEAYRLPPGKPERYALAEEIGTDGGQLVRLLDTPGAPAWLQEVPAAQVLRRVWEQPVYAPDQDGRVRWRVAEDLPPAAEVISSPDDPDARYSKKRETEWVGSKVHLTETCAAGQPHLLTNIETAPAPSADNTMTATIQQHLEERGLTPSEPIVDTSYVTSDHLVSRQKRGIDLVGPVLEDQRWQARAGEGFGAAQFVIDWEAQRARCPQGKTRVAWKPTKDSNGQDVVTIRFASQDCRDCPVRGQCVRSDRERALMIRTQEQHAALQAARQRQTTEAFQEQYAARAGIEGTISQGTRISAVRRSRYIGEAKTRVLHFLIGAALNFVRGAAWLAEVPQARTRRSAFTRLAGAPT